MLNEDKLKLMTSIAMLEKREEKRLDEVNRYFRGDYVGKNMLRAFLGYTFCFCIIGLLFLVLQSDDLFKGMNVEHIQPLLLQAGGIYLTGLILYQAITWYVYRKRYGYASRVMKVYVAKLKRLERRYEFQSKTKEINREVR